MVRGREDFDVLQAAAGLAEEHTLAAAEFFLGWFGPVLVDPLDPAPGDPGQQIGITLHSLPGQLVFHPGQGLLGGVVPDLLQGQGDDGRGPGRHSPCRDGGREHGPFRRLDVPADPGPRKHRLGEAEAAAGLGDADPQPVAEELGRVPAPVISRIPGQPRHSGPHDCRLWFGPLRRHSGSGTGDPPVTPGRPAHRPLYCRRLVSPARDPPGRRAGPRTRPGSRSRRSLPPGAFHGPGRDHLQKFKAPGSFLDPGGEISSRPKIQQRGVPNRPRTQTLQQLNAPGQITGATAVGR